MLLLLLPRLVSNFPVVQQMSSCPSLLHPLPQSLLSVCPLYTLSTFMQQLFNLICLCPLDFVLVSPAHLSLRLCFSLHLNGCQMCRLWAGVRVYTCSAVCVCMRLCVATTETGPASPQPEVDLMRLQFANPFSHRVNTRIALPVPSTQYPLPCRRYPSASSQSEIYRLYFIDVTPAWDWVAAPPAVPVTST